MQAGFDAGSTGGREGVIAPSIVFPEFASPQGKTVGGREPLSCASDAKAGSNMALLNQEYSYSF